MRYRIFLVELFVFGLLAPVNYAVADPAYDCLESSKGRLLRWDSRWQGDKLDNDSTYTVKQSSLEITPPNKTLTLMLMAQGEANKKERSLKVATVSQARDVCDRLFKKTSLEDPFKQSEDLSKLPYIWYSRDGWVRGNSSKNDQLAVCTVEGRHFACRATDKERFGVHLKDIDPSPVY